MSNVFGRLLSVILGDRLHSILEMYVYDVAKALCHDIDCGLESVKLFLCNLSYVMTLDEPKNVDVTNDTVRSDRRLGMCL